MKKILLKADPTSKTWFMKNLGQYGIKDEVKWIKEAELPVWMVIGESDLIVNPKYLKSPAIQRLLGEDKKIKLLVNKDHMPVWDESEGYAGALLSFLRSIIS